MMAHYWKEEHKETPATRQREESGTFKPADTRVSAGNHPRKPPLPSPSGFRPGSRRCRLSCLLSVLGAG